MVMSTSPVGASIRGGKAIVKSVSPIKNMMRNLFSGKKGKEALKKEFTQEELKWMRDLDEKKILEEFADKKALASARIQNQKILSGKGSTGKVGKFETDPDKQGVWDDISYLLDLFSKN